MTAWDILGLAATDNAIAIKKAYAVRLKVTRPDDDAEAYQRLRTAYDWALEAAALQRRRATAPAPAEPGPQHDLPAAQDNEDPSTEPAALAEDSTGASNEDRAPEPDPLPSPRDLVGQTYHYWTAHDDDTLIAGWPALCRALDEQPLSQRGECSNWFAQFVLDQPELPPPFVHQLALYFEWGTDYRTERWLGTPRALALQERLEELKQVIYLHAGTRQQYAHLREFAERVSKSRSRSVPLLFAFLANPRLGQDWRLWRPRQLRAFGIGPKLIGRCGEVLEQAMFLRMAAVLLVALVICALTLHGQDAIPSFLVVFGGSVAFLVESHLRPAIPSRVQASLAWMHRLNFLKSPLLARLKPDPLALAIGCGVFAVAVAEIALRRHGSDWELHGRWFSAVSLALVLGLASLNTSDRPEVWPYLCFALMLSLMAWSGNAHGYTPVLSLSLVWVASNAWVWQRHGEAISARLHSHLESTWAQCRSGSWAHKLKTGARALCWATASLPVLVLALPMAFRAAARRESLAVSLAVLGVAVVSLPWTLHRLLPAWCLLLLGSWLVVCVAMERASHRMVAGDTPPTMAAHTAFAACALLVVGCAAYLLQQWVADHPPPTRREVAAAVSKADPANVENQRKAAQSIARIIQGNISYPNLALDNPVAELALRVDTQGKIISRAITLPSRSPGWDQAVLLAVDKSAPLPADIASQAPPVVVIRFQPHQLR